MNSAISTMLEPEHKVIVFFTDFGISGPYLGQLEAVLFQQALGAKLINLISDAPTANPVRSSYLLAALAKTFKLPTIFLTIVDPGVGGERLPVVLSADGHYFVGPDNGLLNTVAAHSQDAQWWQITWQPKQCSTSFHGRDLFAPVAADLFNGCAENKLLAFELPDTLHDWPVDLSEIIYFDCYGNAMTGLRYHDFMKGLTLTINGHRIAPAETFCQVLIGTAFWYQNSCGLVEIAVNQGRAQDCLALAIGMSVRFND